MQKCADKNVHAEARPGGKCLVELEFAQTYEFRWRVLSPRIGWFLRLAVEHLDTHRNLPEVNPLLPYANSKHAIPVKSDENRIQLERRYQMA